MDGARDVTTELSNPQAGERRDTRAKETNAAVRLHLLLFLEMVLITLVYRTKTRDVMTRFIINLMSFQFFSSEQ